MLLLEFGKKRKRITQRVLFIYFLKYRNSVHHRFVAESSNLLLFVKSNWEHNLYLNQKLSHSNTVRVASNMLKENSKIREGKVQSNATPEELEVCDSVAKSFVVKHKGRGGFALFLGTFVPLGLIGAAAAWTYLNCCNIALCRENVFAQEFIKC